MYSNVIAGMKEYQAEATFLHYVYFHGGARHAGYNPIAAGGKSGIFCQALVQIQVQARVPTGPKVE